MSPPGPQILVSTYQGSLENWPIWNIYMHEYKFIFKRKKYRNREVVLHIWGKGWQARRATTCPRPGAGPRGNTHPRGQGPCPRGATPRPRSGDAAERSNPTSKDLLLGGAGGPRGATPRSRSGGAAVRRYPSSKISSSGCALLDLPWRDTPRLR